MWAGYISGHKSAAARFKRNVQEGVKSIQTDLQARAPVTARYQPGELVTLIRLAEMSVGPSQTAGQCAGRQQAG